MKIVIYKPIILSASWYLRPRNMSYEGYTWRNDNKQMIIKSVVVLILLWNYSRTYIFASALRWNNITQSYFATWMTCLSPFSRLSMTSATVATSNRAALNQARVWAVSWPVAFPVSSVSVSRVSKAPNLQQQGRFVNSAVPVWDVKSHGRFVHVTWIEREGFRMWPLRKGMYTPEMGCFVMGTLREQDLSGRFRNSSWHPIEDIRVASKSPLWKFVFFLSISSK